MCDEARLKEILSRASFGADISIIEGVMGLYDGKSPLSNRGSSYEIVEITDTPVLLVIDASGMARSAAALVKGFQALSLGVNICGVFANKVGSVGHFNLVKQAVEAECGIPVLGYLKRDEQISLPERYAGLDPLLANAYEEKFSYLSKIVQESVDLSKLYKLMGRQKSHLVREEVYGFSPAKSSIKIGVARDAAFHFYYEENLEILQQLGAEIIYFSPIKDQELPEVDDLYIGGGFPERYAKELSANESMKYSIKKAIKAGMPSFAEGGGFMYLTERILDREGQAYPMVGVIPGEAQMHDRFQGLGYRTVQALTEDGLLDPKEKARGHVFHYSSFTPYEALEPAFQLSGRLGDYLDGVAIEQLSASYVHLHFTSSPGFLHRWIEACH